MSAPEYCPHLSSLSPTASSAMATRLSLLLLDVLDKQGKGNAAARHNLNHWRGDRPCMAPGWLQRFPFIAVRAVDGAQVCAMASSVDEVNAQRVPRTSKCGEEGRRRQVVPSGQAVERGVFEQRASGGRESWATRGRFGPTRVLVSFSLFIFYFPFPHLKFNLESNLNLNFMINCPQISCTI